MCKEFCWSLNVFSPDNNIKRNVVECCGFVWIVSAQRKLKRISKFRCCDYRKPAVSWWVRVPRNLRAAKCHSFAHNERPKVSDAERRWVLSRIVRRLILSASLILETVHFRRKEKASYPHSPGHKGSQCRTDRGCCTTSWNILPYPQRFLQPLYWNNKNSDFLPIWRCFSR